MFHGGIDILLWLKDCYRGTCYIVLSALPSFAKLLFTLAYHSLTGSVASAELSDTVGACLYRQPALRHGSGYYALPGLKSQ